MTTLPEIKGLSGTEAFPEHRNTAAPTSSTEELAIPRPPPATVGRYRVLGWLGSGGMGEVLAAHDGKLGRTVAIKRLRPDLVATEQRRRWLESEAQLNARLSHPNIVQVYDFLTSDGLDHIVSEYVEGETLLEHCRRERPSVQRAIEILLGVARGLDAAHRHNIVHCDLKLENVLLGRDGQAKIADFGIAALGKRETPPGESGTPDPSGLPRREANPGDDLHALGVLAYEILSGAPLNGLASGGPTRRRDLRRPLAEVASAVPVELSNLVERLLDPRDALRPATAREVELELDALASRATVANRPSEETRIQFRQISALALHAAIGTREIGQMARALADWHRHVREVAARYQAHVVSPDGQEVILCVGYPRVYGDNCAAAANLAAELVGSSGSIRVAAGIDVGRVAVIDHPGGPIVTGAAVDAARTLARDASPGAVHVTAPAYRILSRSFRLSPIATDSSGGARSTVAVSYRLEGQLDWKPRGPLVASPLIGRADALASLRDTEQRALAPASREHALLVVGAPGSGKSRLVQAFLAETIAARTIFARGTEETKSVAFAAFARLLRDLPELRSDGAPPTRDAVARCIGGMKDGSPELIAAVAHVTGVQTSDDERLLREAAPFERHSFVAEHVGHFLVAVLASDPSLLLVEDIHWLDTSSLEVLAALGRSIRDQSIFVLGTSRPSLRIAELSEAQFRRYELTPLARADAAHLADVAARGWVLPPRVARAIVERAAGIPLLLEELTHFVADRAVVDSSGTSGIDVQAIPTTFADAVLARFQDLGPQTRRVAQLAASIGNEIDETLLLAITGMNGDELRPHVELLSREGLLHGTALGERRSFGFRHALTRDVLYDAQDVATRTESHRAIVEKVDTLFPEWEAQHPELLARQCDGAGELRRAALAWVAAGHRATARWSAPVACQHFESALQALSKASSEDWAVREELVVRRAYAPVLTALTNWCSDLANANNARIRELSTTAEQPLDWTSVFLSLATDYTSGAADELSAKLGWLAAQLDQSPTPNPLNRYLLESMRGVVSVHAGYLSQARAHLETALQHREALLPILQTFPLPEPMLIPRAYLAWVALLEGDLDAAWRYQMAEEASFEPGTPAHTTALSWGAQLASVAHDWAALRKRAEVVVKSEIIGTPHVCLSELSLAALELRRRSAEEPLSPSVVEDLIGAGRRAFIRWRGEPAQIRLCVPLYLAVLTDACLEAVRSLGPRSPGGKVASKHAGDYIVEMLTLAEEGNILDRYIISEVYRLHAERLDLAGATSDAKPVRLEALRRARALAVAGKSSPLFLERRIQRSEARG